MRWPLQSPRQSYNHGQACRCGTGGEPFPLCSCFAQQLQQLSRPITIAHVQWHQRLGHWFQAAVPAGKSKDEARVEATDRFNDINMQLSTLATNFSNNLLDSTAAFKKLITEKADVSGLPTSFLGQAAQKVCLPCPYQYQPTLDCQSLEAPHSIDKAIFSPSAKVLADCPRKASMPLQAAEAGHAGATADSGPWLIGLDQPSYTAVMTYADNRCVGCHCGAGDGSQTSRRPVS